MKLERKEIRQLSLKVEDMLQTDGTYEMVDGALETQSTSIYFVRDGKIYDDESYEMTGTFYSDVEIEELQQELDQDNLYMALLFEDKFNDYIS